MPRTKQKLELHNKPGIHDVFHSLAAMPKWVEILSEHSGKDYCPFLKWLNNKCFFKDSDINITMKQLSTDSGLADSVRITKWLHEAYDDILTLQHDTPDIFKEGSGVRQHYYVRYYDDTAHLTMWLPVVPRMFENIRIPFLYAKFGLENFWVCDVYYDITEIGLEVTVWLKGGFNGNPYREMFFHRAQFEGKLSQFDKRDKYDSEIDKELFEMYKK